MICFELHVNGRKITTSGISTEGVMTAIITLVTANPKRKREQALDITLGGLEQDKHLKWYENDKLKVGDEITVRIIESLSSDQPSLKYRYDPEEDRKARKKYFEELKKEFEDDHENEDLS